MIHRRSHGDLEMHRPPSLQPFSLAALLLVLLLPPSLSEPNNTHYLDCREPTALPCGDSNYSIAFPFGAPDRANYCSYPAFHLTCLLDSMVMINIGGDGGFYQVKQIDYANRVLTVADPYFASRSCPPPQAFGHATLNFTLVGYTDVDVNLTVYINCTVNPMLSFLREITCLTAQLQLPSYYTFDTALLSELSGSCGSVGIVPMNRIAARSMETGATGFGDALREGFEVTWSVGQEWCGACVGSGGVCGYDAGRPDDRICFCPNTNSTTGTCASSAGFTLILLSSSISLPTSLASASAAADDPNMADCEPTSCGNGVNISYPFWLHGQQPPYCGFPEFGLDCAHNAPLLSMSHNQYLIRSIFYHNQSLLVSNSEFFDAPSDCPLHLHNLTFSLTPFNVSSENMELVFLTNCTEVPPEHYRVTCANGNHDTFAYLAAAGDREREHLGSSGACESTIMIVPVLGYPGANGGDYTELLEDGFLLEWAAADCSECSASSGRCGYDGAKERFMCICPDRTYDISCEKRDVWKKIALGVGVGGATLIAACFLCFFWFWRKKRRQSSATSNLLGQSASSDLSSIKDTEFGSINCHTHIFSYGELQEATNGFDASRELGDGGFGTVYKGKLRDGRIVAIKRLYENNYKRVEQFMNEVEILSRLRHPNLVNLYGCTSRHSRELLLVYEFVPNGTVADHLHGPQVAKGALSWHVRLRIAIETADALAYLHAAEHQIIHRDVKTNNILLDDNFHVKVADFGLSRLFPIDVTHVSTLPQGTPGYVDPDYHMCYQLTDKSDVYSFGVVLVELISSKPAVDISRQRHEVNLAYMAISMIQNRQLEQLVDPGLGYRTDGETERMITLVAELAFMCLQGEKEMRPSIKEVLEELRRIQSGGCKAEKGAEADIRTREDVQLLKISTPFSPDSVMGRWESRLTTPNTSD